MLPSVGMDVTEATPALLRYNYSLEQNTRLCKYKIYLLVFKE